MDLYEFDQRVRKAMKEMPAELHPWLLEVLTSSEEARAKAIGKLHAEIPGSALGELLIDVEEEHRAEQIRAMMVGYLFRLQRDDPAGGRDQ